MLSNTLRNFLFKTDKYSIPINILPSQGYFYPDGLEIYLEKGSDEDRESYLNGFYNSTIFGITDTIKSILIKKVTFNQKNFTFEKVKAIDILFIFIEFIKYTTDKPVYFNSVEFNKDNFIYFDFKEFENNYDEKEKCFTFNNWKYSLPTIGIESSLGKFSYEITMRGQSSKYENKNYNFIYFLSDKTSINFDKMVDLINLYDELSDENKEEIQIIVDKFSKSGIYFLLESGKKPIRINSNMLQNAWKKERKE